MTTTMELSQIGIASGATDAFNAIPFVTGDEPSIKTTDETVHSTDVVAYAVVGRDATTGNIVIANATSAKAIGIAAFAAAAASPIVIYRSGTFNPDMLVWDASYSTALLKKLAFEATGAQIFTLKPQGPQG